MRIVGRKPVLEALLSDQSIQRILIADTARGEVIHDIISAAKKRQIRIDRISSGRVNKELGASRHQGVGAELSPVTFFSISDIDTNSVPVRHGVLIALDHITDPYHLGAIARVALGAGCDGIILPDRRSAPISEVAVKASAGALLRIPIIRVSSLTNALRLIRDEDWWISGASADGTAKLWEYKWSKKSVLVFGSEGKGISRGVAGICDDLISLPLMNSLESLSVSTAVAVFLFENLRCRNETEKQNS
ncbi:MAG: 23S rRNA (guanosine(2251)-2'-O)-methyltransferase RlmB [Candidatus Electryonea clarkiae]|nr:23S rRNA (guanosine(2251)-2'-O)-methyltransferase RlmB [Candidatus Electryonea clarkiae]MDP8288379.1 23S rRNA (guanosine(2251)-2'-O)-methyltransferase RlmB [Candidatus Electryonea clarkiae]